ncbi:amino acid ABC transporter permease [Catelliglobosispora koreensis]|uniref:amino acid ABC transporter permease n=1 Tax=Catelliglobosispora koreensis TaxID=129052 RepID=UPI00036B8867|nr:amino acid ABC transporter permease [Catelliglobosispora koreensis]
MSRETSVLYDAPGPRAKRRTIILSVVIGLAAVALLYQFVYKPLDAKGQFSMVKWGPLIDPDNEYFDGVWDRLWVGAKATMQAAALAIVFSALVGLVLGVIRILLRAVSTRRYATLPPAVAYGLRGLTWVLNALTRVCVEFFRGIPVVITIFFAWQLLGGTFLPVVVGLVIYNGIVIAEIVRSGMEGVAKGQREAAESLGLSSLQTTRLILLPQAIRTMLPALISQIVVVLKDTALGGIIVAGYEELIATSRQVSQLLPQLAFDQELYNPLQFFTIVCLMFLVVNYALSKLAQYLERRLSTKADAKPVKVTSAAGTGV